MRESDTFRARAPGDNAAASSSSSSAGTRPTAVGEAARMGGTHRPPAGATRLAQPPHGVLTSPALGSGETKYQVDDVQLSGGAELAAGIAKIIHQPWPVTP